MNCSETFSAGLASFHSHVVTQNTALGLAISAAPRVLRQSGGTAYKHTRRAFACAALLLAICVVAKQVSAQTYSETIENGGTVPSQQPAGPSNSFPLTNIENYSPYTGAMSLHIPLHHIGGRGDAGYDVVANIATHWSVTKTFYSTNGDVANVDITTDTWPNLQNQPLGIGVTNSFNYQGVCPQQTILGGQPYVTSSLPRYQIKRNDGSAATLRDQGLDGNASGAPGCSSTQSTYDAGRGSSAVTRDGSHVVFQLTSPNKILDSVIPINPAQSLAGTLIEPTGVRYQINGFGSVTSMEDRNGNQISFTPNSAGGYDHILYIDPSSLASVTDPLGRVTTFNMSSLGGTIQYPGYSNSPQIAVNSAMLSTVLRDDFKAQGTLSLNTLFPGVTPTNVFDQATISSIAYLDNSTYTFKYNQYGEIARVVLPTGGAIEYDFVPASSLFPGGLVGNLSDTFLVTVYRRLSVRRVYDANSALMGTTTYTWASENTTGLVTTETTTDAGGHILSVRTTHFSNDPTVERYLFPTAYPDWQWGRATKVEEGSPVARTTTYKWQPSPYTPVTWCGNNNCQNPPEADPEMYEQDVTLNDTSQQSKSMFGYDQYNNVTSDQEYDWGQGAPGSLLRKTINSYQGTPYTDTSHQLLHLLSLMQIFDGQGKLVAQTHFGYDESSPSGTPGIIGHDSNYDVNFNVRGNLTNPANCFNPPACTVYLNHGRQFDIAGNVTASSDANGNKTTYTYNDDQSNVYAFPTTITPPTVNQVSQATTATYNYNVGKPASVTDANGVKTLYTYNDPLDRLTQIKAAANTSVEAQTNVSYTGATQVDVYRSLSSTSTDVTSLHTQTNYDGFGRAAQANQYEDSGYITTVKSYDALGRLSTITNPYRVGNSSWYQMWGGVFNTTYVYDSLGRVQSVTTPDNASVMTTYAGNKTTTTDQAGKRRTVVTDWLGRITGVIEDPNQTGYAGLNYTTVYGYDALDDLTCVNQSGTALGNACQPGIAHARSFTYDAVKRLTGATNPESGTISYNYDKVGNLWSKIDARGVTTCFGASVSGTTCSNDGYDALNRPIIKSYSDGTPQVSYSYDIAPAGASAANSNFVGRLVQVGNCCTSAGAPISSTTFLGYDALGRVTSSSQVTQGVLPQPVTFTFSQYSYNFAGSLTSETLPSGRVINMTYDAANRPITLQGVKGTSVTNYIGNPSVQYAAADSQNSIQYAPHGGVWAYTRGDTITRAEEYNNRLQPIESNYSLGNVNSPSANSPSAMLFVSCPHWGVGKASTAFTIPQICPSGTSMSDNGNLVGYDEYLGAPGATSYTSFSQSSITYDGVNRLTNVVDSGNWSRSFAYDQWGNMAVSAATGVTPLNVNTPQASDPTTIFSANNQRTDAGQGYDQAGNVTAMYVFSNLTYDAENRLLTASAPTPFTYAYDGDGRRVTKTGAGNTSVYVYDAAGRLVAEYDTAAQPTSPCTTCYLSYDHLGSVRMVTDSAGHVVSRHDFLPFGEEIPQGQAGRSASLLFGGTDDVTQRFTGKERDSESGLDYFGARYYGSALGRFTSPDFSKAPDPIPYADLGNPQSLNLYSYVLNRPLTSFDRDGHTHQECGPDTWDPQSHTVTAHCHDVPDWYNLWTRFQNWNEKNNDEWNKRIAAHQPPPQARNKENLLNDINDVAMGMIPTTSPFRSLYRRFYEETKGLSHEQRVEWVRKELDGVEQKSGGEIKFPVDEDLGDMHVFGGSRNEALVVTESGKLLRGNLQDVVAGDLSKATEIQP